MSDPQYVQDYLDLPDLVSADQFVAKVTEDEDDKVVQQVRQYVLPDPIEPLLDGLLRDIGKAKKNNQPLGRWLFGSFGCGKSHLMAILGLMLENDERLWEHTGEAKIRSLRDQHRELIENDDVLVVRLNMMEQPELRVAFYEAFNDAMRERGEPTYPFVDLDEGVEVVEEQVERFGLESVEDELREEGILRPSQSLEGILTNFEELGREEKLEFTKNVLEWHMPGMTFGDPGKEDFVGGAEKRQEMAQKAQYLDLYMNFNDGLDAMAEHAWQHGFRSITLLLDEFIIWARGLKTRAYAREMNAMSALVDSQGGARKVSFAVISAIQREFARQFEVGDQAQLREDLNFVQDRFERLEMVDTALHEVAKGRVLKPKEGMAQAFDDARKEALDANPEVKQALALDGPTKVVEELAPFHPALIRVLVDVTQGLNRSRGALEVLYDLLVNEMPELEVGSFVPLGKVFDSLFQPELVASIKESPGEMQRKLLAHWETYRRLVPQMKDACGVDADGENNEAYQNLALLVKSVLLLQVSYRKNEPGGEQEPWEITSELLYKLNTHEIDSFTPRGASQKVEKLFRDLSLESGLVHVDDADPAHIQIETESVDTDELLRDAQGQVTYARLEREFTQLLREELAGIDFGRSQSVRYKCNWRGRKMPGHVEIRNVRKIPYSSGNNEFAPEEGEEYRFFVDYPFDTEGYTREHDVDKMQKARADRGPSPTAAWLPTHLSEDEKDQVRKLAAIQVVEDKPDSYWDEYSSRERDTLESQLSSQKTAVRNRLLEAIRAHYVEHAGQVDDIVGFMDDLNAPKLDDTIKSKQNLADIPDLVIREILNARYPDHPNFERNEMRAKLDRLARILGRAVGAPNDRVDLDSSEEKVVRDYGVPLELFALGEGAATVKRDGKYLEALEEVHGDGAGRLNVGDLQAKLSEEPFGLSDDCASLIIWAFSLTETFRVVESEGESGRTASIDSVQDLEDRHFLVRGEIADVHEVQEAQKLARELFGERYRGQNEQLELATMQAMSLTQQDRFADSVRRHANAAVEFIEGIEEVLEELCDALDVDPETSDRLEELTEARVWLASFGRISNSLEVVRRIAKPPADKQPVVDALEEFATLLPEEHQAMAGLGEHADRLRGLGTHGASDEWNELKRDLTDLLRDRLSERRFVDVAADLKERIRERYQEEVVGPESEPAPATECDVDDIVTDVSNAGVDLEAQVVIAGDELSLSDLLAAIESEGSAESAFDRQLSEGRWRATLSLIREEGEDDAAE